MSRYTYNTAEENLSMLKLTHLLTVCIHIFEEILYVSYES